MTGFGVLAGAAMPYQPTTSQPGTPDSEIVGMLGATGVRFGPVTAWSSAGLFWRAAAPRWS
jgi:hypothetical protein